MLYNSSRLHPKKVLITSSECLIPKYHFLEGINIY